MYIAQYLNLNAGHSGLTFVDIDVDRDNRLFLDPCLIEHANDEISLRAQKTLHSFEDKLFYEMKNEDWNNTNIFDHAHEVHSTKLGYGNGLNGKGKTSKGLKESLDLLRTLVCDIDTISKIQDITIFVKDFAEDNMSDLLTNLLRKHLNDFTASIMRQYGIEPTGAQSYYFWNSETNSWDVSVEPFWVLGNKKILLVPKHWVRKRFIFRTHQYLMRVIVERLRNCAEYADFSKKEIRSCLERTSDHWEYDNVIDYTKENPDALEEYHDLLNHLYNNAGGCMSDKELDQVVYFIDENIA